jgi:hypothetical protein
MNEYFGSEIEQNEYAVRWLQIFKTKEKNVDLLMDIVECDSEDEEDNSIGHQMIAIFIMENNLWVSVENYHEIMKGINAFLRSRGKIEEKLANKMRDQIFKLSDKFFRHADTKIVRDDYNPCIDISNAIEKQIVNGLSSEEALSGALEALMGIAKNKYKLNLQIGLPDVLIEVLNGIKDRILNDQESKEIVNKLDRIINHKRWSI